MNIRREHIIATPWVQSISAITLFCEDVAASKGFYRDVFGLDVFYEDDVSAVFRFGQTLVNLLAVSEAPTLIAPATVGTKSAGNRAVITIPVADVDAVCAELTGRGVTLLNGPIDRPWGIRTASFQDPAGHIWEIAHDL